MSPYITALAIMGAFVSICALWVGWIWMWHRISGHRLWGLMAALSPIFIGGYFLLVWKIQNPS